jgi:signal transduction histidine kinase
VDLDDVVEQLAVARRRHSARQIDTRGVVPVQVRGDRPQLERAVANLLDNASATPGTGWWSRSARPATAPSSPSPTTAPVSRPTPGRRVFERFTRLDDARSVADGGVGLGLAIARDIAERHGGTLELAADGPGARFVLTLPLAPRAAHDRATGRIGSSAAG